MMTAFFNMLRESDEDCRHDNHYTSGTCYLEMYC